MINTNRIVPVMKMDLLTLLGTVMNIANVDYEVVKSSDVYGTFTINSTGVKLADQPIKTCDFTAESGTVYFIPAYDFEGFAVNGAGVAIDELDTDGVTLYKAELTGGAVTVTAVSPVSE